MEINHIKTIIIIIIILMSGILGGIVNALKDKENNWKLHITLAILASFTIPLFLNFGSSSLIEDIYDKNNNKQYSNLFVMLGFCLVAAYSSGGFLQLLTGRLMNKINETQEALKETQVRIEQTQQTVARVDQNVNNIAVNDTSNESKIPQETILQESQKNETVELLTSIKNDNSLFTPMNNIKKEVSIDSDKVEEKLNELKEKNIVKEVILNDEGEKAIAVTQLGEKVLEQAMNNNL